MPARTTRSHGPACVTSAAWLLAGTLGLLLCPRAARADETEVCVSAAEESQVLRRDAHLRAAREKLLACARDACPGVVQTDCKRWLSEVEVAMPTVVIRATDAAGHALPAVRVLVDGIEQARPLHGKALALDPGERTLRVESGGKAVEQVLTIRAGEGYRVVSMAFPGPPARSPGPPPAGDAPVASRGVPVGPLILGGLGLAAMGSGVAFWAEGLSVRANLYATCGPTHACSASSVDSAKTELAVGDLGFGVGLAAAGAALWWALAAPSTPAPAPLAPRSARATFHALPGGGLVGVEGSF